MPVSGNSSFPRVTFWGAAQTVTGSMHLIETGRQRILLDCGMYRGPREETRRRNSRFPFHANQIDAVILSHAHIDHCGNLPGLVKQGFHGPIFSTPPTQDLVEIMLMDSARIQEEDARHAGLVGLTDIGSDALFTRADVSRVLDLFVPVPYGQQRRINEDATFQFFDAGHILGSAMTRVMLNSSGREHTITFTGDLGRRGLPFVPEPKAPPPADLLISESTYGGSRHKTLQFMAQVMAEVVRETQERGGKVLIPAFSLGRTQVVVHYLLKWMREGVIPSLPLIVDSPLALHISQVYGQYPDYLEPGSIPDIAERGTNTAVPAVRYLARHEDSDRITRHPDPCIIVASGGMCESGRILRHLKHHIDDPRSTLVLVSYQAPTSLGRKLLEHRPTVRFMGRAWNKWLDIVELNGFSGHADHDDFLALLGPLAGQVKKVRLVHGEKEQAEALARSLRENGFGDVAVPLPGESVSLT
ncbi:MAG: MBL fold metallo-hydrolase [Gemmataceae bacterium]